MKILITDDEEPIRELIKYNVEKNGYETVCAENALQAVQLARSEKPSLLILDLMLPDMSGLDVCRILKGDESTRSIPIIMVTAKTEESDIVTGLELGADDYITKPFSPKVLLARILSVLRRSQNFNSGATAGDVLTAGPVSVDIPRHEVLVEGKRSDFTATEFAILEHLVRHAGQVFSRQQIINAIKGADYPVTERAIDVQILSIRHKLADAGCREMIETIRGVGYRFYGDGDGE